MQMAITGYGSRLAEFWQRKHSKQQLVVQMEQEKVTDQSE
jgi:hypothetical protein